MEITKLSTKGQIVIPEKMREGIVDFEKLKILKTKAARSTDPGIKKLLQELEQHLQTFTGEHEFNKHKLQSQIQRGKNIVEELSDRLMAPAAKTK